MVNEQKGLEGIEPSNISTTKGYYTPFIKITSQFYLPARQTRFPNSLTSYNTKSFNLAIVIEFTTTVVTS